MAQAPAKPAHARASATATELLPDIDQMAPSNVQVGRFGSEWRLGFDSTVINKGDGPLKIEGNGPGDPSPMAADQLIQMSDATEKRVSAIGQMRYVRANHNHWHLLDFEHYELRSVTHPAVVVSDNKTGFCLANDFTASFCGLDSPDLTQVTEGLAVGGTDVYGAYLEGQYVPIDPAGTPTGEYYLVNRANPPVPGFTQLREKTLANNAASVRVQLTWSEASPTTPTIKVLSICPGTPECPPPAPLPQPQPQPQPEPQSPPEPQPQPPADTTTPQSTATVPTPPPPQSKPASVPSSDMSLVAAIDLARTAIGKVTKGKAARVRTACHRTSPSSYSCRVAWVQSRTRWRGDIRVSYRVLRGDLQSSYRVTAVSHPGNRRIQATSAGVRRALAPRAVVALFNRGVALLCRFVPKAA